MDLVGLKEALLAGGPDRKILGERTFPGMPVDTVP